MTMMNRYRSAAAADAAVAAAEYDRVYALVFDALEAGGRPLGMDERREIADAAGRTAEFRARNPFVRLA